MPPKKNFNKGEPKTPVTSDSRFTSVHNDPRFMRPKKKDMKVTIDKRFSGMMKSTDFSDGPRVDKYGRRLQQGTAEKELKRFYQLEEDQDSDEDEDKSLEQLEKELAEDEENLRDEESESDEEDIDARQGYDPMRGRGEISSSDEDTDDTDAEVESEEEEIDEIDKIKHIADGEETSRLALVNMDWDKIKAVDILKVLSGFKPDTGIIKSVSIYPSEFGKERLLLEDTQGPPQEIFKNKKIEANSDNDDEEITAESIVKNQLEEGDGQDFDQEALRKYQLDRLKYYYAVIECNDSQTAKVIYRTCDNTEYESSANFFDLRYIPEDMTFDDQPKDIATEAPEGYTPTKYKTDALQRTKVSLTWDEDDVDRFQVTRREFTQDDIKALDFDAYLASSEDEEEDGEDVDALREKYRKLLGGSNKSAYEDKADEDEEGDMEITFTPGLSEAAGAAVKNMGAEPEREETSIETYLRKQKEKRKAKKVAKQTDTKEDEDEDSEVDAETENDPFFKEAMEEMADEGFVAKKKTDKKAAKANKKRASKEEREEKARERAELELLMDDDGKSEGFNMKEVLKREKLEKKGKKGKKSKNDLGEDDFEINVTDPRFAAVQESHHFAIDPTNPQFKKTKSMQKLMNARQEKMKEGSTAANDEWKKNKTSKNSKNDSNSGDKSKSSLNQLVASVKRKAGLDKNSTGKRQKN
ncbi:unnamed protein product [Mucor hiemalis]